MHLDRPDDFVGKTALGKIRQAGVRRRRVGYVIGGERIRGISDWRDVFLGAEVVGTVTEAVYSPRLRQNIAVGMLSAGIADDVGGLEINLGDGRRPASVTSLPFVGK